MDRELKSILDNLSSFLSSAEKEIPRKEEVSFIPKGRGRKDRIIYEFFNYIYKENRAKIKEKTRKAIMDYYLYGKPLDFHKEI